MQNTFLKFVLFILIITINSFQDIKAQSESKSELISKIEFCEKNNCDYQKDTTYIKLLNKLCFELKYDNNDSVRLISKKSIKYSKQIGYKKGIATAYLNLGIYDILSGNNSDKESNKIDSSINICKEIKYDSLLSVAYNAKAIDYIHINKYEEAYINYLKALKIAETLKDTVFQTILNTNIATLFTIFDKETESITYFNKALILAKNQENSINLGQIKGNLGNLYLKKGELDKALILINESIEIFKNTNFDPWLSFAYTTKGSIYLEKDSLDIALSYYKKSDSLLANIQDNIRKADLLLGFSKVYLKKKNYNASLNYAKEGLELAEEINYQNGSVKFYDILYQLHKIKNKPILALKYLEHYKTTSDSIDLKDKENQLTLLNAKEQFHKEKQEINETTNKVIKKQQSYISYILIALFIAISFSYYVYSSKNIIKGLNKQLKQKTENLEENEVRLQSINENQEKLFSIIGHDLKAPIIALKNILKLIKDGSIKPEEFTPFVPKLYNDVDAMSFTLNNLIYWGKTQMKGFKIFPKKMDLKTSIDESIKLLSEIANQKKISIINESTENCYILADKNHINLIIRNLISNAIKYSKKEDKIILKTNELPNHYELIIKDNGIGISKETLTKLSNIESLVESTYGTNNEKGTGIGLKLCYEMIALNGGSIRVKSEIDKGTTFYITFPKAKI